MQLLSVAELKMMIEKQLLGVTLLTLKLMRKKMLQMIQMITTELMFVTLTMSDNLCLRYHCFTGGTAVLHGVHNSAEDNVT